MTTSRRRSALRTAVLVTVSVALVAGCGGSSASGSSSTAPASSPATSPGDAGPTPITIVAEGIAFLPASMRAPAGSELQVTFENRDAGVPHNVALYGDAAFSTKLFESEVKAGPVTDRFEIPGLIAGSYQFTCTVHPNMTATLTIGA
jgi:plastocyanin